MWLSETLPFIQGLRIYNPEMKLSKIQPSWLGFCLMGIILTSSMLGEI